MLCVDAPITIACRVTYAEHFKQFNSYVQGFRALGLYDSSVGDLSLKIASRVTVDGGDVLECRSDQVGELADKLVVRHASAVSTELPIQLDPCSTYGVC
eukprot:1184817-Prorocentrum_minimum.AAC.1